MNILVTGANGFIGQRLSSRLIDQGHQVFGLSLKSPSNTPLGFKAYYQQDISKPFSLNGTFDLVIHLAAYNITHVGDKDGGHYTAINVDGTKHVLQAVQTKKFILLSTAKVYKNVGIPLTEDSPLEAKGAYEQSKLKAEEACQAFFKKGSLVILRPVNVVGWGQAAKAVIPVFFEKAKTNQPLDIIYPAHTPMQFVYVDDLADAVMFLISHENVDGIFNIAHEKTVNLEQLARAVITITHSSSVLNITRNAPEMLFSPVVCAKAYQQLGWKANTGLPKILELYGEAYAGRL
jgi:nucleoside-diphosphate-sugar epimerase